jgi:hypothetical protein
MTEIPPGDRRLTRYLLGEADAEEQAEIELRALDDSAFHDELRAAERDLIDRYVHGELSDPAAFEQRFLSSPQRRERVEFARALKRSLDAAPAAAAAPAARPRGWLIRSVFLFDVSVPAWQLAAASVVFVFGAALLLLAWQRQHRPREAPRVVQQPPGPGPNLPPIGPGNPPPRGPSAPAAPPGFATLVLMPTLTRGADDPTPAVTVERDAAVRLELRLDSADYARYRATVRTADGAEVAAQDRLQAERTSAGALLVVTIPASQLTAEDYTVRVSGIARDGEADDVASYYFKVRRGR